LVQLVAVASPLTALVLIAPPAQQEIPPLASVSRESLELLALPPGAEPAAVP
jgi:hypothetical protein